MPSNRDKSAERRAEAAFNLQRDLINQQTVFLEQQNAQAQSVIDNISQAQAQSAELRQEAIDDARAAIAGQPSPSLERFLQEEEERVRETIRRNVPGGGAESSSPGIALNESSVLSRAAAIDQARQGNIGAAIGATSNLEGTEANRLNQLLAAGQQPLVGSQILGQSAVNLGRLAQGTRTQDPNRLLFDIGRSAVAGLGSQPNFFSNVGSNLSSLGSAGSSGLSAINNLFRGGGGSSGSLGTNTLGKAFQKKIFP